MVDVESQDGGVGGCGGRDHAGYRMYRRRCAAVVDCVQRSHPDCGGSGRQHGDQIYVAGVAAVWLLSRARRSDELRSAATVSLQAMTCQPNMGSLDQATIVADEDSPPSDETPTSEAAPPLSVGLPLLYSRRYYTASHNGGKMNGV